VLIPNRHWGGEGLLGCVFGFGFLHRIPPQPLDRVPGSVPPELQEEFEEQELFVPADLESPVPRLHNAQNATNGTQYNPTETTAQPHPHTIASQEPSLM